MLRTSFTLAEKFFSLVINLSHLRRVLRGSVLGPWRLREDEHNERFRPFEPQIRRQGTAVESETAVAARRLIKGSRWSVKCVRGGGGGRRGGGEREMRRLIFGCDLKQLFLCGALKMDPRSFPSRPATLFMLPVYRLRRAGEPLLPRREKENQCHRRNQSPPPKNSGSQKIPVM